MEDLVFETTPHPVYGDYPMDLYFAEKVREIVRDYGITTFVETGVDKASTAMTVARICDKYIGIELKNESCELAKKDLKKTALQMQKLFKEIHQLYC